jgi:hypothetical protein
LLIAAFAWTFLDGRSLQAMDFLRFVSGFKVHHVESMMLSGGVWNTISTTAICAALLAISTFATMFISLFAGSRRFRLTRSWLLFTALACGWLGFLVGWPEVYWNGQQRRMRAVLIPAEELARHLDANWPAEDGNLTGVGPFLAYPIGDPTTLLPLQWAGFPKTRLRFAAIERTNEGALRFELSGSELGAWLEWHPDGREPATFVSGLDSTYTIIRQQRLAPNWFVVRYRASH